MTVRFSRLDIEQSIINRFAAQVKAFPTRPAIVDGQATLTYAELDAASSRVAHAILETTGASAAPVALLFGHNIWMIIAILGVLKAGKMYLSLNPDLPLLRLGNTIEDAGTKVIITQRSDQRLARNLARVDAQRILLMDEIQNQWPATPLPIKSDARDYAALYFTSGSTGQPKNIIWTHRNLLTNTWRYASHDHTRSTDRYPLVFPFTFGASSGPLFTALLNGACVCIYDVKKKGVNGIPDWLRQEKITVLHISISMFRHLLKLFTPREELRNIRLVILGGDTLFKKDVEGFRKIFPADVRLVHQMVSHEATMICRYPISADTQLDSFVIPIGRSLEGVTVHLLDKVGQPVQPGETGQMVIESDFLSPGYWQRPDLTAAAFKKPGFYYSGDLVRCRPDGLLEFIGRDDFQIKLRGYTINIKEIEGALFSSFLVKNAVVTAETDAVGEKKLTAYVEPLYEPPPSVTDLRRYLADVLPDYMIPATFVLLDELPLNEHGKVDLQALTNRKIDRPMLPEKYYEPRNLIENQLTVIWRAALNLRIVGVKDDFYDMGGHSLLAAFVLSEIQKEMGVTIPYDAMLQHSTIEKLALYIQKHGLDPAWRVLVPLQKGDRQRPALFCIHPRHGTIDRYLPLVKQLGPKQPVFALQARALDGITPTAKTVEEMAADYINEIQQRQPKGPYYLCGYSFGGRIAYEMAQQLHQQGLAVAMLCLIDTSFVPSLDREQPPTDHNSVAQKIIGPIKQYGQEIQTMLATCRTAGTTEGGKYLAWRIRRAIDLRIHPKKRQIREDEWDAPINQVRRANSRASQRYKPRPYLGSMVYINAASDEHNSANDWAKQATGPVEIIEIAANHRTMLEEPAVIAIAGIIQEKLKEQ